MVNAQAGRLNPRKKLEDGGTVLPTGGWALKSGGVLLWSPEMYRICGFDPTLGPPSYLDVMARVHPADATELDHRIQAAFVQGVSLEGEYRLILPGGPIRHIHYWVYPVPAEGGAMEFVGMIMDVTERRLAGHASPGL